MSKITPSQLLPIYEAHLAMWADLMDDQMHNTDLILNKVPGTPIPMASQMVGAITGALLYTDPGVIGIPGLRGEGDHELAAGVANEFLKRNIEAIHTWTTNALIYDGPSVLALRPRMARDVMDRVVGLPMPAWRVIIDYSVPTYETSRWFGLISELPLEVAEETYGHVGQWAAHDRKAVTIAPPIKGELYVTVVEVWIMSEGRCVTWSPDFDPDKWVYEGEEFQVGGRAETQEDQEAAETVNVDGMLYSSTGSPLVPLIFLNLNPHPLTPNFGTSFLSENRRQLDALNAVSTAQANMAMKARRLYRLADNAALDDTVRQVLEGKQDNAVVIVKNTGDMPIGDVLTPIPLLPVPPDVASYKADLQADLEKATSLPAFSMGQATKATATEVNQLTAYADSKLGQMSSVLARSVAQAAEVAVAMIRVMLGDEQETIVLPKPVGPKMIQASDLEGDWRFVAADGAGTPAAAAKRAGDIERLSPLLIQLGVPPQTVLKELVQAYSLPESLLEQAQANTAPQEVPDEV